MEINYLLVAIKVIIFISILNVWLLKFNKPTPWRGGSAQSMKEEFKTYRLSEAMMYLVGGLKILFATLIFASIWLPQLAVPGAAGMAILMLGAISMHFKVKDPLKKSFPAFSFLVLSLIIIGMYYF
jgi:hypothetical protein